MNLQHLYPTPSAFSENENVVFRFGAQATLFLNRSLDPACVERMGTLWNRFCCTASKLDVRVAACSDEPPCLRLGAPSVVPLRPAASDEYTLRIDETGAAVAANTEDGLFHGFLTLVQMIEPECLSEGHERFLLHAAEVRDAPAVGMRAVHLCVFPESKPSLLERAIHLAGFLKMTHIVLEFWGTYEYKALPELAWRGKSFSAPDAKALVDLAHEYRMEVIPMVNHFGHASASRSILGRHVVLNANPRLAKLFEPDGWTWCLSNPDTYKLQADMREEMFELCGAGSYFHLGFDEAYSFATCRLCKKRVPHELLADYVNRLTEDLSARGRRPILWHDEFIDAADFAGKTKCSVVASGQNHGTAPALDRLDRRTVLADWQYEYRNGENATTRYFMDKGFDVLLSPWDDLENVRSLAENAKTMGAKGVLCTTWHHLPDYLPRFPAVADMLWKRDAGKTEIPWTEAAAILRTLYDAEGDFDRSGWSPYEVLA